MNGGLDLPLEPSLQNNASAYLVDQGLVLACLLADAAGQHGLVGHHAGVALVPPVDGNVGQGLAELTYKTAYARQIVAVLTVGLARQSHYKSLHGFALDVILQKLQQFSCVDGGQPIGYYLQRVRHSNSCATDPVIYREDSTQTIYIR